MVKSLKLREQLASITEETFNGVRLNSIGSEPSVRNAPPIVGPGYTCKQKRNREKLKKVEGDMIRTMLREVAKALNNQVKLPFQISEFEQAKDGGKVPLHTSGRFGAIQSPTRLTADKGPAVVTDLDGVPIFWYFPSFLGGGLRTNLLKCISDLALAYQPPADDKVKDQRGGPQRVQAHSGVAPLRERRYMTRSGSTNQSTSILEELVEEKEEEAERLHGSICKLEETSDAPKDMAPQSYHNSEGEVRLEQQYQSQPDRDQDDLLTVKDTNVDNLANYKSFAYYFAPGWCQTGMQYVRPVAMSVHFRNALCQALQPTIRLLEAKRLLDKKIALLVDIIQPDLSRSMRELRAHLSAVKGPTEIAIMNGWTSAFPCNGYAINRETGMHRDHRGMRGGLDIIGVLGNFSQGGDLELPDLDLRIEWTPGCLGALDGYDFRHFVHPWSGGSRVTLISFCQKATWSALGLQPVLKRPSLSECNIQLKLAQERRNLTQPRDGSRRNQTEKLQKQDEDMRIDQTRAVRQPEDTVEEPITYITSDNKHNDFKRQRVG